jgi:hypothetical protein
VKKTNVVRAYYVLPCCLLLLNLVNNLISYKAELIADLWLRTTIVILLVLFGGSLVAFVVSPAIEGLVRLLHRGSRQGAGQLGEAVFLLLLGAVVFWLYYQLSAGGPEAILPRQWWNGAGR